MKSRHQGYQLPQGGDGEDLVPSQSAWRLLPI